MTLSPSFGELFAAGEFAERHIGPQPDELARMLAAVGVASLDELIDQAVPAAIRHAALDALAGPGTEPEVLARLRALAAQNRPMVSLIGQGYYGTHTPGVIKRNLLENPAWYTAYTPYQPEISQGRLEALLNFQTMVADLTGLDVANASMLDEATAAAEAMTMARRLTKRPAHRFFIHHDTHPQTVNVVLTRAEPLGIDVVIGDLDQLTGEAGDSDFFGALFSYPTSTGAVTDWRAAIDHAHALGAQAIVATDLAACVLLTSPGELGADIAIGSAQRFGVPMGYGGPHAGFMAVRESATRVLPGRLVGVSSDTAGRPALRLALQTREQHIRREKATSNICTSQVLLANIAGMYAAWHGPDGLRRISTRIAALAAALADHLASAGLALRHDGIFDTVTVDGVDADAVVSAAAERGLNVRRISPTAVGISLDETVTSRTVDLVAEAFGTGPLAWGEPTSRIPLELRRTGDVLPQAVFRTHHSEHAMLRYLRRLADRDLALDRTMIPLGSCTMKLNATSEMEPITWPEFADVHPYAPDDQTVGYRTMIAELEDALAAITGYAAVSVQPNAGSQGELAGLLAIRAYHRSRGDEQRTVCLIPSSAHGTNAASAVMAGLEVVVVKCDDRGNVDLADLADAIARVNGTEVGERLAAIMVTYPSTHGVFEEGIRDLCQMVHAGGGQVYVDGANLNALVGLAQPGEFGSDVSHLNLHKTFCIPHGGGGPGVGPVGVREHLVPFLPGDPLAAPGSTPVGPVSAAKYGSAGILPIPWVYVQLMGADGLTRATETAILAANYVTGRLSPAFPVLYTGTSGRVAHECIIDIRGITRDTGVTVDDIAKRLIDYGFHAPTMSFPVAGTLMIEPTESESLDELDRFCEAMLAIRSEIDDIAAGIVPIESSALRNAPHPAADLLGKWEQPYSQEHAAYPVEGLRDTKYWPPVSRIDGAYGDRNLACTCDALEAFATPR
ncbi:MAG TPA: aminomethyl-transferring glycine dehydrogenase [Ilumatobacter sp.]|nr:aminomethyl-transferring glycine dehydrogenase [Ilumatobacter sp.]